MEVDFVNNPPHPEQEWSACTAYSPKATALRPLLDRKLKDVSICKGPDGWYLTGTAMDSDGGEGMRGLPLWKSSDLSDWRWVGYVSWANGEREILRPRLHFLQGHFWIAYGVKGGGTALLRSDSEKAEGPYRHVGRMTDEGEDASLFVEDNGEVYWVAGDGAVARMKPGLTGLAEPLHPLEITPYHVRGRSDKPYRTGSNRIGSRGASIIKLGGLYVLLGADTMYRMGCASEDTFAAVSERLHGPYSRRYLLIPHGGRATLIQGPDRELYAFFSGCGSYSVVENSPAMVRCVVEGRGFVRPDANAIFENGPVGRLQPAADFSIRDPQICLAQDGRYYLTGTSNRPNGNFWEGNDELHVWSSHDLRNWSHIGKVWDLHIDGTWQNAIRPSPCLWAPEIAFIRGTFWITYSLKGGSTGLLKSVSGTAAGPYIDMGRLTDRHIDSSLFADEDGEVYYVWQDGWIARMKPDMTGFAEHPRKLLTVDGTTVGYEGAFIVKYRGKYLLGAAEWNGDERVDGTYDMMVSVSDRLYGPYSPRQVAVPHGGHGTMFVNRDGELMATLFGNDRTAPFRTKLGIVRLECRFERGGAVIFPV
jgi:beta-xylosidase